MNVYTRAPWQATLADHEKKLGTLKFRLSEWRACSNHCAAACLNASAGMHSKQSQSSRQFWPEKNLLDQKTSYTKGGRPCAFRRVACCLRSFWGIICSILSLFLWGSHGVAMKFLFSLVLFCGMYFEMEHVSKCCEEGAPYGICGQRVSCALMQFNWGPPVANHASWYSEKRW